MRTDISVLTSSKDVTFEDRVTSVLYEMKYSHEDERFLYCTVMIPHQFSMSERELTIDVSPVYFASTKTLRIGLQYHYNQNESEVVWTNTNLGKDSFKSVRACDLLAISTKRLSLSFVARRCFVSAGENLDLKVEAADTQNRNMLLACVPGNCYRYPTTGVGLIRFMNGNLSVAQLAKTLKEQFSADGTPVNSASYDYDTRKLYLSLNTPN